MSQPSLEDLAREAKSHPGGSTKRKIALTALIQGIEEQLPSLRQHGFEAHIDEEARQELFVYICKNIDNYQENQPVMHWVRTVLRFRRIDAYNFNTQRVQRGQIAQVYSGDVTLSDEETGQTLLDRYQPPEVNPLPSQELVTIIKEDPEGLFANKLFKENPKANFRAIALMRLDEISWRQIVEELETGTNPGPVSTFYQRCCEEFKPKFEEYLQGGK